MTAVCAHSRNTEQTLLSLCLQVWLPRHECPGFRVPFFRLRIILWFFKVQSSKCSLQFDVNLWSQTMRAGNILPVLEWRRNLFTLRMKARLLPHSKEVLWHHKKNADTHTHTQCKSLEPPSCVHIWMRVFQPLNANKESDSVLTALEMKHEDAQGGPQPGTLVSTDTLNNNHFHADFPWNILRYCKWS